MNELVPVTVTRALSVRFPEDITTRLPAPVIPPSIVVESVVVILTLLAVIELPVPSKARESDTKFPPLRLILEFKSTVPVVASSLSVPDVETIAPSTVTSVPLRVISPSALEIPLTWTDPSPPAPALVASMLSEPVPVIAIESSAPSMEKPPAPVRKSTVPSVASVNASSARSSILIEFVA